MSDERLEYDNNPEPTSTPERYEDSREYVNLGEDVGQVIPVGSEEVRSRLREDRLENERRVHRVLHCCQHVSQGSLGDAFARCVVMNRSICPRPECTARCWSCRSLTCARHLSIHEGRPYCDNCRKRPAPDWFLLAIAVTILVLLLCMLRRPGGMP